MPTRRPRRSPLTIVAALAAVAAGCGDGPTAPTTRRLPSGVELSVAVTPARPRAGEPVALTVHVRNPTADTLHVTSTCSLVAMLQVRRADGREVPELSVSACLDLMLPLRLAPGADVGYTVPDPTYASPDNVVRLPAGAYVARATSLLGPDMSAGSGSAPFVERRFTVR